MLLIASGSEVELAMKAQPILAESGIKARVVSMPSWEVFEKQNPAYRESVLPSKIRARLAIEAASGFGWERYIGLDGDIVCMPGYGASGPAPKVFVKFGFTVENVVAHALALMGMN
jgi:transketolase